MTKSIVTVIEHLLYFPEFFYASSARTYC